MSQNTMHNLQTLPTTSGRPLTIGARLRYRYAPAAEAQWRWDWEQIIGTITAIEPAAELHHTLINVTLQPDSGEAHTARLIWLHDGSAQMQSVDYFAEVLT